MRLLGLEEERNALGLSEMAPHIPERHQDRRDVERLLRKITEALAEKHGIAVTDADSVEPA
jgi:hypothetical protein